MYRDINGIELKKGMFVKLTGCKTKYENDIYIVDKYYMEEENYTPHDEYLLNAVKLNGEKKETGYKLYFLYGENFKRENEQGLKVEVVTDLKAAKKEVNVYLKERNGNEVIHSFVETESTTAEVGKYIHIKKGVLLRGHQNKFSGRYIVKSIDNNRILFHLIGSKGEKISQNTNNRYGFTPITFSLPMDQFSLLFTEYGAVMEERKSSTKAETQQINEEKKETVEVSVTVPEEPIEIDTVEKEEVKEVETMGNNTVEVNRKYYDINENTARLAKNMNSFSDYKQGDATELYKYQCNKVYNVLEEIKTKKPELLEKAEGMADRYVRKLAEYYNDYYRNEAYCPSVMISGGSNFPVRKKEKQNSRRETLHNIWNYLQEYAEKIEHLLTQEQIIKSNDENAIQLLEIKVQELEERKQTMKDINSYYRKNGTLEGFSGNISDEEKRHIQFIFSQGLEKFGLFDTSNINQQINNTKARLVSLKKIKEKGSTETNAMDQEGNSLFQVIENTEIMRLQLLFDGIPEVETRDILKKNGFKWSPKNKAWQRQLTDNAKYSLKRIKQELNIA